MFKQFGHAALASLLGASMLIMPTEVSAITILPVQKDALVQVNSAQEGLYQEVQSRRTSDLRRSYLRHRNGRYYPRYRYRHGPYRYYRHGYWYDTPWWTLAIPFGLATGAIIAGSNNGSAHVRWCSERYRSYNPRTNTWVGNSGRVYQCNSPYDGR
jgi:BA14K-like protein